MFLPTPMHYFEVFLAEEDVERATASLARLGVFEIEGEEAPGWGEAAPRWGELAEAHALKKDRADRLFEALDMDPPPRVAPPRPPLGEPPERAEVALERAEEEVQGWRRRRDEASHRLERLGHLRELLRLLESSDLPIEDLRGEGALYWLVGAIPRASLVAEERSGAARLAPRGRRAFVLNVYTTERDVERAVETIMRLEEAELSPTARDAKEGDGSEWSELAGRLGEAAKRAERLIEVLGLKSSLPSFPEEISLRRDAAAVPEALEEIEARVRRWQQERSRAEKERDELAERRRQVLALEALDLRLGELHASRFLRWAAATLAEGELAELELRLTDLAAVVAPVEEREGRVLAIFAAAGDDFDVALRAMAPFCEPVPLPQELEDTPARAARELEDAASRVHARLLELEEERQRLASRVGPRIAALWRRALSAREVATAIAGTPRHRDLYRVSARLPGAAVDSARAAIEAATGGRLEVEARDLTADVGGAAAPIEEALFGIPFACVPIAPLEEDRVLVIAAASRRDGEVLERGMRALFMHPLELPEEERGVPAEILPALEKRLQGARADLSDLEREREALSKRWRHTLVAVRLQAASGLTLAEAIRQMPQERGVYLLSGWVPAAAASEVLAAVETATDGRADAAMTKVAPSGRRRPPTRFSNPSLLRPFEALVRVFGYPTYGELDPTPVVAVSFTLMYGMMFGDVGHGMLVSLLGLLVFRRAEGTASAIGAVLIVSGLSAALFGLLYGSLFGREELIGALWLRPLGGVMEILTFSVGAGAVLLTIGLLVGLAGRIRARQWQQAIFGASGVAGLWLYVALVGGGYAAYQGFFSWTLWLALVAAPAALLLLQEPLTRLLKRERPLVTGPIGSFVAGAFFELFGTLLVNFSSTLSFLRLGAFAIAHLALMRVVFALAGATGAIAGGAIVVFGTALVVAFEGFVVAIQALRLEYYEFFSKFFRGEGRAFRPLRLAEDRR